MQGENGGDPRVDLTTGFLARRYGVSLRTLRFYEEKGLLKPTRIGRVRLFSAQDKIRLELILTGKKLGFSLREIGAIIQSHFANSQAAPATMSAVLDLETVQGQLSLLERQKADLEATIADLKAFLTRPTPDHA